MLLNAYYAQMKSLHTYKAVKVADVQGRTNLGPAYPYNYNMYEYPLKMMRFENLATYQTGKSSNGVVFGDGTTPVTVNDYWLSGNQINTLTVTGSRTYETDDNGITYTGLYTITNPTNGAVTISEVGYMHKLGRDGDAYGDYYLIDRTLLDTPLTIPAGGIGTLTYKIRVNFPT